jgi:hypothetical protein
VTLAFRCEKKVVRSSLYLLEPLTGIQQSAFGQMKPFSLSGRTARWLNAEC